MIIKNLYFVVLILVLNMHWLSNNYLITSFFIHKSPEYYTITAELNVKRTQQTEQLQLIT